MAELRASASPAMNEERDADIIWHAMTGPPLRGNNTGHHGAPVQRRTINVARARSARSFPTTRVMSESGGWTQLVSPSHGTEKASTASARGAQYLELKRRWKWLSPSAKRSTV